MRTEFEAIFKLGRAEKLQLVEDLWDSITPEESVPPVSDALRNELTRRKQHFDANPESGRTWEQVKARARRQDD
ncbi:MAG: addiction module protein [Planctomycetota bacterium]